MSQPQFFTATSAYSLAAVSAIAAVATVGSRVYLPKNARWQDKATFIWLVRRFRSTRNSLQGVSETNCNSIHQAFDALIHFSFEGSFLYLSTFGRSVNASQGIFAELWKEYAHADFRWGFSDPTVVSLEILTVLGAGPMCVYILRQLARQDPAHHYWIVVLSTAELYGGWMTFCPEWLTGSPNLDTSNPLYLYVYLIVSFLQFPVLMTDLN